MWFSFFPHTWQALATQMVRGFPFQAAHGIGNVVIALAAGPALLRILDRYGARLRIDYASTGEPLVRTDARGHPSPPPDSIVAPEVARVVRGP